jgi:hypothetical protein
MAKFRMLVLQTDTHTAYRFQRRICFFWLNCGLDGKLYHAEQLSRGGHLQLFCKERADAVLKELCSKGKVPTPKWEVVK